MNYNKLMRVLRAAALSTDIEPPLKNEAIDLLLECQDELKNGDNPQYKTLKLHNSNIVVPYSAWEEANNFMRHGKKIHAIKVIRAATGLGLKESKDLVETPGNFDPEQNK